MLQQTQVRTVIPYWERWMRELPDVHSVARADLDRVFKLWEGLGYYRRARHLRQAAQVVVSQFDGEVPNQLDSLLTLPGIGRYTAGAICSIAFDHPAPILDGNVIRVLARLRGISGRVETTQVTTRLWAAAGELVQLADVGRARLQRPCASLNQALMELGATICKPRQPECAACPVQAMCKGLQTGQIHRLPNLAKRPRTRKRQFIAFVASRNGRVAVRQRPDDGVNASLWEFPNIEITGVRQPRSGNRVAPGRLDIETVRGLAASCVGFEPLQIEPLCTVSHSITRFRIEVAAYVAQVAKVPTQRGAGIKWRTLSRLEKLAWPSAHRRILAALGARKSAEG